MSEESHPFDERPTTPSYYEARLPQQPQLCPGGSPTPALIRRLRLSAESDQGKDERGEHGDTQDATKRIHPPQHLVASPPREGRRSEDDRTSRARPWGWPSHITADATNHPTSCQLGSCASVIRPVFLLRNIQPRNPL